MPETVVIDPVSEDAANSPLTLTTGSYGLTEHRYPQPPIDPQWASSVSTEGSVLASQRYQNREISITVEVDCTSNLTPLRTLQAKLAKLAREGGTLQRTMSDATVIVFDVLTTDGYDPSFDQAWHLGNITTVSFSLTCKPYGRGPQQTLTSHAETTLPLLIFTETGIKGDVPAEGSLTVTDNSANAQSLALWGLRSATYDSAATAALFYQAESLVLYGTAVTSATPASASGGSCVDATLTTSYSARIGISDLAAASKTHKGSYRLFARVQAKTTNTGVVSMRLGWAPSFGMSFTYNTIQTLNPAQEGVWQVVDLGRISPLDVPVGSSDAWYGHIEALSTVNADHVYFDHIFLIPIDEGSGQSDGVVLFSGRVPITASLSMVITSAGVFSEYVAGKYGPAPHYAGDYLHIPPAGPEGRTLQVIVKLARGRDSLAAWDSGVDDPGIDDLTGRLVYTPRYLVVPSS